MQRIGTRTVIFFFCIVQILILQGCQKVPILVPSFKKLLHGHSQDLFQLIPGLNYWEGVIRAKSSDGSILGRGFAELTGYHPDGRLPL